MEPTGTKHTETDELRRKIKELEEAISYVRQRSARAGEILNEFFNVLKANKEK